MRMKTISETRTLRDVSNEFLAYKKAGKARERTLRDYQKYIDKDYYLIPLYCTIEKTNQHIKNNDKNGREIFS